MIRFYNLKATPINQLCIFGYYKDSSAFSDVRFSVSDRVCQAGFNI